MLALFQIGEDARDRISREWSGPPNRDFELPMSTADRFRFVFRPRQGTHRRRRSLRGVAARPSGHAERRCHLRCFGLLPQILPKILRRSLEQTSNRRI